MVAALAETAMEMETGVKMKMSGQAEDRTRSRAADETVKRCGRSPEWRRRRW